MAKVPGFLVRTSGFVTSDAGGIDILQTVHVMI